MSYQICSSVPPCVNVVGFDQYATQIGVTGVWEFALTDTSSLAEFTPNYVYAEAVDNSEIYGFSTSFDVHVVCGSETVSLVTPGTPWEIVRARSDPPATESVVITVATYFSNDKSGDCPITRLDAFSDDALASAWADPGVVLQDPTVLPGVNFLISKGAAFAKTIYLRARTAAMVANYIEVHVIICGNEDITAVSVSASET